MVIMKIKALTNKFMLTFTVSNEILRHNVNSYITMSRLKRTGFHDSNEFFETGFDCSVKLSSNKGTWQRYGDGWVRL